MTERDLSSLLLDHLTDEPPVAITSSEAVRSGRRQGLVRGLVAGGIAVTVLGAGAATLATHGGDQPGRAKDDTAPATRTQPLLTSTLEGIAAERLGPYLGDLGEPTWDVTSVDGSPVEPDAEEAQFFQLSYQPAGGSQVHLRVGGFAGDDAAMFVVPACPAAEESDTVTSCTDETLPDGTIVTTAVGPHTRVTNTGSRLPSVRWALRHPDLVLWARSVNVVTTGGVLTAASEYVEATAPENADWKVPEDVLRAVATDPGLTDPAGVAHEPLG